jgi:hypothetical protein
MLYWSEIITHLAKILAWFCSKCFKFTNVLCVSLLSHDRYQYDGLILSKQTWAYPRQHLQLSCHSVAVVLTPGQTKQTIYINETIQNTTTTSTKIQVQILPKYKYTYCQDKVNHPNINFFNKQFSQASTMKSASGVVDTPVQFYSTLYPRTLQLSLARQPQLEGTFGSLDGDFILKASGSIPLCWY